MLAKCTNEDSVRKAADANLAFLRVGENASDGAKAINAVRMVKDAGLLCRYSMMKAYVSTPEALVEEARMLQDASVDKITIMDSAGTMFPGEVTDYVRAMKKAVTIPVGFHGHSNLGPSQANALAAAEVGVPLYPLIAKVCAQDRKSPSQTLIREITAELK